MRTIRLQPAGSDRVVEIAIERPGDGVYCFRIGDDTVQVEIDNAGAGAGRLVLQGEVVPFYVLERDNQVHVWMRGRTFCFAPVDRVARQVAAGAAAPSQEEVTAPMPGTILQICAAAGDAFEAHQPLIIMESMKMEMTLSVPHAGRVRKVTCKVGELVQMNAPLVKLEPLDDEHAA